MIMRAPCTEHDASDASNKEFLTISNNHLTVAVISSRKMLSPMNQLEGVRVVQCDVIWHIVLLNSHPSIFLHCAWTNGGKNQLKQRLKLGRGIYFKEKFLFMMVIDF